MDLSLAMNAAAEAHEQVRDLRGIYKDYLLKVASLGLSLQLSRTWGDLSGFVDLSIPGFEFKSEFVTPPEGSRFVVSKEDKTDVYRITLCRLKKTPTFFNKNKVRKTLLFSVCVYKIESRTIDIFLSSHPITNVYFSEGDLPDIYEYVAGVRRVIDTAKEYLEASASI